MDFFGLGLGSVFEEICFCFASFATMSSASMYSKYKSVARNLDAAPIFTVGPDLTRSMKKQSNLPYAVITGRVFPLENNKTLETLSGMPAVVSKLNVKEFRWVDLFTSTVAAKIDFGDGLLSPALRYVPFALSNPNTSRSSPLDSAYVMVDDVSNGEFDQLLLTAKATYVPTEVTITGLIASFLRGFHSVGIETSEDVLPIGTVITVIGEVTKLSGDGSGFRVAKSAAGGGTTPYILTTKSILEVRGHIRAQATVFKVISLLCGCITLMTFYVLGKKWLPRFRLRRVQQLIQRQRSRLSTEGTSGLHETQICLACLQNPREVALMPCGHVCLCADCSLLIQEKCPICRETVFETLPIYLA